MTTKEVSCIVGNMCFIGSIISRDGFASLLLMVLGLVWLITFVIEVKREVRIHNMKQRIKYSEMRIANMRAYNNFLRACRDASIKEMKKKRPKKK